MDDLTKEHFELHDEKIDLLERRIDALEGEVQIMKERAWHEESMEHAKFEKQAAQKGHFFESLVVILIIIEIVEMWIRH